MTTAIVNATILDGTGRDPVANGTLILDGDIIERVGSGIEPPRGAHIIGAGRATVRPGMTEWPETLVDGPDEVRKATRELLRAGADFIKLHATGGVLSPTDEPTDTGFTPEEIAIMVYEARARGKTCMAHAQGTQGIKNAVKAGVESIEHGTFMDEEVIDEMVRRGTFVVPTFVAGTWVRRYGERA